jgi:hypothetical protein
MLESFPEAASMLEPTKDCCHLVGVNRFKAEVGTTTPENKFQISHSTVYLKNGKSDINKCTKGNMDNSTIFSNDTI